MSSAALSREMRLGSGPFLAARRKVVGLSLVAMGAMAPIALYQIGIIKHLPEPPLPMLNADAVDASAEAYAILAIPDAFLALGSYAATAALAAMAGTDRAETKPWIPLALAAKVALDAAVSAKLTVDQWTKHRAFCSWCLLGAGATFATMPLVVPETRAALRRLSR
jgi:hypothetical protein